MVKANPTVPIGAIASSWGGTPMEVWMPPQAFTACDYNDKTEPETAAPRRREDPGMYVAKITHLPFSFMRIAHV